MDTNPPPQGKHYSHNPGKYKNPRESKAEQHITLIRRMRTNEWPYTGIQKYLETHFGVQISEAALRKFCLRRGITKGSPPRSGGCDPASGAPDNPRR